MIAPLDLQYGVAERQPVRRALLSVSAKRGLIDLARGLAATGVEIVSTGSTAAHIAEAGIAVTQVGDLTGFPEAFGGRVKTLHPAVHAGILADRRDPEHERQLAELGIEPFDLVVVNLYPFRETVQSDADVEQCIEQIDIGGPAMIRAAAKNAAVVAVVVSPARYADVIAAVESGGFTLEQRRRLAAEAFAHTASYDVAVAGWYARALGPTEQRWPEFAANALSLRSVLRYGENPHQQAALYTDANIPPGLAQAEQLHGKEMSFNNYVDADAARRAAYDQLDACVAVVKHANPCGIAVSPAGDIAEAHRKAHACDPISAFGGVIASNRTLTGEAAAQIAEVFTEVVVAPDFEDIAVEVLTAKKNIRLLSCPAPLPSNRIEWRQLSGGVLTQTADAIDAEGDHPAAWQLVAGDPADDALLEELVFAWRACRSVKSNAILIAADGAAIGIGMGQVSRVDSARLAVFRAGEDRVRGAVAASDAFFPFPDGLEVLTAAGVRAVVQPGGSVRDEEVIAAARSTGTTMYLTGTRHFYH